MEGDAFGILRAGGRENTDQGGGRRGNVIHQPGPEGGGGVFLPPPAGRPTRSNKFIAVFICLPLQLPTKTFVYISLQGKNDVIETAVDVIVCVCVVRA